MADKLVLIAGKGGGSTMIEALLTLGGLDFTREEIEWEDIYATNPRLAAVNPAGHIPALLLPNGEIVTESIALALLIDEMAPQANLAPKPGNLERPLFLRALAMLGATIYPMWTFDDLPERWVGEDEAGQKTLRERTDARRKELWTILDSLLKGEPWALGERFSAVDVFVSIMTRWRPRREWFAQNLPKLYGIATRVDALPAVQPVWARNFD